jgi:hypothetical protein
MEEQQDQRARKTVSRPSEVRFLHFTLLKNPYENSLFINF